MVARFYKLLLIRIPHSPDSWLDIVASPEEDLGNDIVRDTANSSLCKSQRKIR